MTTTLILRSEGGMTKFKPMPLKKLSVASVRQGLLQGLIDSQTQQMQSGAEEMAMQVRPGSGHLPPPDDAAADRGDALQWPDGADDHRVCVQRSDGTDGH